MTVDESDLASLWDMLAAARSIQTFTARISYESFQSDVMRLRAVEREFEIIGEAARLLTRPFRDANPQLLTGKMIGLRNVIAHGYAEVDYRVLHRVATVDVPELIRALESLVPGSNPPRPG